MAHNENTRVKIPAILHLCRLGFEYLPLSQARWDKQTNIFTDIFRKSFFRLNPDTDDAHVKRVLEDLTLALDFEDLGQAFYKKLIGHPDFKLIDFQNFNNNAFHVVTELECEHDGENFRPDITLLVNGLPLAFVEVKKPNNRDGILAERNRINTRFQNRKFRRFINISQLLVFSNNMEYDSESIVPIQGAFYATTGREEAIFNCFREAENPGLNALLHPEDDTVENFVLKDNNLAIIKHSPELATNKAPDTPTNRILTALFSRERFAFLLRYGIAYVKEQNGLEKHIMRYPQMFATKAIEQRLESGVKKGIIWHTQGSGKTALAYYSVHYLTDYFQKKGVVPKFYFIVDRLDLMVQAKREFDARGLIVHTVNSKDELQADFRKKQVIHNLKGEREITVVNIQKFKDDPQLLKPKDYNIDIQRIYFLDEVHRSYNPAGSFLANLFNSDRDAILIGLTGTPLIGTDRKSRDIFGDYIHKYYYNASIADGYTLKLIREGIETKYRMQLEQALRDVEILKGEADKRVVYAHEKFVEPMLDYIVRDFVDSRARFGDNTIGGMVVCDSSEQAKKLFEIFQEKYAQPLLTVQTKETEYALAADSAAAPALHGKKRPLSAALILHDIGTKEDRKTEVEDFKAGTIDLLFVYNMLLTGFDAKRLKKLYLGRIVKDHNLLQTLTRVNRPYKNFQYGYVVDFADIRKEFDATNKAYFEELQQELGDEMESYSNLFKSKEEIDAEIAEIKEFLWTFDTGNKEIFSQQITAIQDKKQVLEIKKILQNARELYNLIRLLGHHELLEKLDFQTINALHTETTNHLNNLNLKDALRNQTDSTNLLNAALENVLFLFRKVSEHEMVLADKLKDTLRQTRETLAGNMDQQDPEFVSLYEELRRLFDKKNLDEITQDDMVANIGALRDIHDRATELNRKNNLLKAKYNGDAKYARIHKRIREQGGTSQRESDLHETLLRVKSQADEKVLVNHRLLDNEGYFSQMMMQLVLQGFSKNIPALTPDAARFINLCVVKEYTQEFRGQPAW